MTTADTELTSKSSANSANMVDVIIVNWNAGVLLKSCVDSVLEHGGQLVRKIIVVDNDSQDFSDRAIEGVEKVTLIRTGENLGFGKACNLGAEYAKSDYLLFLNPDAALLAGTLQKSVEHLQNSANATVGICGAQLLNQRGQVSRSCARFPSVKTFTCHAIGLDRLVPRLGHVMTEWDHLKSQHVDHVIGAYFLVRRTLFEQIEGFDERFFLYMEDLDFSYRSYLVGWRSTYLADAQAFHVGGGTSNQIKARRLFYSLRSRLQYSFKHFSLKGALLVMLVSLLLEPLSRCFLAILRLSWRQFKEAWLAYGMLWQWLSNWLFKGDRH